MLYRHDTCWQYSIVLSGVFWPAGGVVDLCYRLVPVTLKAVVELSSLTDALPVIGEGRHGTVLLARLRGDLVALKFVNPVRHAVAVLLIRWTTDMNLV
jgi:hypothetical protein